MSKDIVDDAIDQERTFKADETREQIEQLYSTDISSVDHVPETIEAFVKEVVEQGTFTPDARVKASLELSRRERLTGDRDQDMTAMIAIGMMLGAALERDIPKDSALEGAWRDGTFVLPDSRGSQ